MTCKSTWFGLIWKIEITQYIHEYQSMKDANEIHEWIKNNMSISHTISFPSVDGGPGQYENIIYSIKNKEDMIAFKLRWL